MTDPRSRRRRAPFLLGLIAILAALPVGYFLFLDKPQVSGPIVQAPEPAPALVTDAGVPAAEASLLAELRLKEVRGTVQVRHTGGDWRGASEGDALRASDRVRTLAGSYALLIGGEAVEVSMEEGTEVTVSMLTATLSRLSLGNGMTKMRVKAGSLHTLEMTATGGDNPVVRSKGGEFTVSNNGAGTVAVATTAGEATLASRQREVTVLAGQQSIVLPGQAPSEPAPIPTSLLLKVNWPAHPRRQAVVTGQTDPGTHVVANGETVVPDAKGHFSFPLSLKEGANPVNVQARAVGGLTEAQQHSLTVDTTPPKAVTVDPGLWNDPSPPPP